MVQRQVLIAIFAVSILLAGNAMASEKVIELPSVTGLVADSNGAPIEYSLVVVTVLGSHQKAHTQFGDIFKLTVLHDMTDADGTFTIPSDTVSLVDAQGKKAYLVGCRIEVTHKDYLDSQIDIANLSDSNSGLISVFLNSALSHGGSFFESISAGFSAVKSHSFIPHYVKSLTTEALTLESPETDTDGNEDELSPTISRISRFTTLYGD